MSPHGLRLLACVLALASLASPARGGTPARQACDEVRLEQTGRVTLRRADVEPGLGLVIVLSTGLPVLCITVRQCIWALTLGADMQLGRLGRYAGADACGPRNYKWRGLTQSTACDIAPEVAVALHGMRESLRRVAGASACTSVSISAIGVATLPGASPALILSLPLEAGGATRPGASRDASPTGIAACMRMVWRLDTLRLGIVLTPRCDGLPLIHDQPDAMLPPDAPAGPIAWLAVQAGNDGSGVAVALDDSLRPLPTSARAWGDRLRADYVTAWLSSVSVAANNPSTQSVLATADDPLPMADRTVPLGRLARWLAAASHRLDDPPNGLPSAEQAMRWMARNLAGGDATMAGTVLRREIATRAPGAQ